jgi:hypothetical protein
MVVFVKRFFYKFISLVCVAPVEANDAKKSRLIHDEILKTEASISF